MSIIKIVVLKTLTIGLIGLYYISLLWISMMYFYGWIYSPINNSRFKEYIPFEVVVIFLSLLGLGLLIFKTKGIEFRHLLLQDLGILILGIPFYTIVLDTLTIGIDDLYSSYMPFVIIITMTILTVTLNDWIKIKQPAANHKK